MIEKKIEELTAAINSLTAAITGSQSFSVASEPVTVEVSSESVTVETDSKAPAKKEKKVVEEKPVAEVKVTREELRSLGKQVIDLGGRDKIGVWLQKRDVPNITKLGEDHFGDLKEFLLETLEELGAK